MLGHNIYVCLTLWENVKTFSNMIVLFYSLSAPYGYSISFPTFDFITHLNIIYSGECAVTFSYYFNMYFSDDKPGWAFFLYAYWPIVNLPLWRVRSSPFFIVIGLLLICSSYVYIMQMSSLLFIHMVNSFS